ncbi:MAG TPA: polysaccharide biosynthesis C-terminal domain-containing protein [Polyangia bacterium]|nr:polysaccharide biosynthesis C-terminal domain-containing protein [Polyangia bacterium]
MSDAFTIKAAAAEAPVEPVAGEAPPVAAPQRGETGVTIARNSLWMIFDSVVGMGATLYVSIIMARKMGPDFMGRYNYILYFATFLRTVTEVAIPATVRKFAAEFSGRGDFSLVKTIVSRALRLQSKVLVVGVGVGLTVVFTTFPHDQRIVATIVVLSIVPGLLLSIPTGALWATENLRHNVVSSLVGTFVNMAGVTASVFLGWGMLGIVSALLMSRIVDCVLRFAIFRKLYARLPGQAQPALEPVVRARMIRFAAQQLVLALLYSLLFDRTEVFFLHRYSTPREIAFFSITFTLVQYMLFIPQNLAGSASVSMWVQQGRSPKDAARTAATATWFIMILAAPELLGVAAISDPLLRVMYGAKYLPAIPVLATLCVFALSLTISQPAQYMLVGAERQRFFLLWMCLAGTVDVIANVLLIPHFGALGAAYAKGTSELIASLGFIVYLVSIFRAHLPLWRMFRLLVASVVMFAVVRVVGRHLPPLLALVLGIPLGALVFFVFVRLLRCLDRTDGDRLRQLKRVVPSLLQGPYMRLVSLLVVGSGDGALQHG